jgi:ABC-type amino acid transport substrate-binding protein
MLSGKFVEYSDPFYANAVYPYIRSNETRFTSRADLNKKDVRFTGIDGDLSIDLVQRLFPQATFSSMPATTDVAQLLLNVATKKADVAIVDPGVFTAFAKTNPGKIKSAFKDKPLGQYKGVISVKKGDFKMLGLVNQAVDNALAFGIVDEDLDAFDPKHEKILRVKSRYAF